MADPSATIPGMPWMRTRGSIKDFVYQRDHPSVRDGEGWQWMEGEEAKRSGARSVSTDFIRAIALRDDGSQVSAAVPTFQGLADRDPVLFDRLRARVLEAIRLQPHDNPPTPQDSEHSGPHLASGVVFDLTHAHRHIKSIMNQPDNVASVKFNAEHAEHHAEGALDHINRLVDWCRLNVTGFDAEYAKLQAHLAGEKPKPEESKSDSLDSDGRRRRLRQIRTGPPTRDVKLLPGLSHVGVRFDLGVIDGMIATARANRQVEVGGLLFAKRTSTNPLMILAASEPGPGARCSPESFASDVDHDLSVIEDQADRGRVECGRWHAHWASFGDRDRLRDPSPGDLRCWSEARQLAGAQRFCGLLLVMFERSTGQGAELFPYLVDDSISGYADLVHRAAVV